MIRVSDLHKTYRNVSAVRGLSFDVLPGQILGLVGPNGAGKTTTMRAIAGIIRPTSGVIEVAGHNVRIAPLKAKKALAYVPDDPALFGSLTVYEHLVLAARAYEVADYRARADDLMRRFQISDRRDTLAQELSRGVRSRPRCMGVDMSQDHGRGQGPVPSRPVGPARWGGGCAPLIHPTGVE